MNTSVLRNDVLYTIVTPEEGERVILKDLSAPLPYSSASTLPVRFVPSDVGLSIFIIPIKRYTKERLAANVAKLSITSLILHVHVDIWRIIMSLIYVEITRILNIYSSKSGNIVNIPHMLKLLQ